MKSTHPARLWANIKQLLLKVESNRKIFLAALLIFVGISWKNSSDNSLAKANQVQGLYIFTDSTPMGEYEYLGTVKNSGAVSFRSGQYEPVRNSLIKKVKDDYPSATGIIFHFLKGGSDKADAIRFKQ